MLSLNKVRPRVIGSFPAIPLLLSVAYCQSSVASYNGTHAIVGARIEVGDGHIIEKGTVVVRNGMIIAVASDAAVPRGAEVLDGKGLIVYPGFIDAYTTKGFAAPATPAAKDPDTVTSDYASAFMRESVRKGIRPELRSTSNLSLTDDVVKPYLSAGFTTILVAPSGADMNGTAALVNLSGRPTRECVLLASVAQVFGFGASAWGDGYPSSLMGHIAQLRQTLFDAQWYRALETSFEAGGIHRPPSDDSLAALQTLISGKIPAAFDADNEYQIERSLDICAEFGLKPIIVGGTEAWKRIAMIKASGAPVLLSVAFGKDPDAKIPETASPAVPKPEGDRPKAPEPVNPAKAAEHQRLYREAVRNAGVLAKEGVPIALTSKGTKTLSEFFDNIRKAVDAGFPKDAALRCLTIDAAKIFGADRQTGSIEPGKIANLIVMTGDFLDAKTKVKMLYIDGRKIDPAKSGDASSPKIRFGSEGN